MSKFLTKKTFSNFYFKNTPTKKVLLTLLVLFLFRLGNTIPIAGIDQDALKKSFLDPMNRSGILQIVNMYSGGGGATLLSSFSLGIIPFINASIFVDLLTAIFPSLEKLQSEEGESGRRQLMLYKKILTFVFAIIQSIFLISYLKAYFYSSDFYNFSLFVTELVSGAMIVVWLSNIIDNKGIGNGTSIIIFTNIVVTLISKSFLISQKIDLSFAVQILFLLILMLLICISQTARINIEVVSARQLAFLQNIEKTNQNIETSFQMKENGLSIRLNQAGIFPIIIASNILPLISYVTENFLGQPTNGIFATILYYVCIIGFNYFYTIIFWDPEKIAEQLRKASVSIVNITPGRETVSYLENVVKASSLSGGILLCIILISYDFTKNLVNGLLLNQINISSLIILVGVAYDIQKVTRSLYKNAL